MAGATEIDEAAAIQIAVGWTRYYTGWADEITGEVTGSLRAHGEFAYTLTQPYRVIGAIITWNAPLFRWA
ncbi:aldehyde dehydrogenase family protein [Mycobacterium arosiense]|uniref:aldehyde dehydrogenase family protein n=1 Tax=Mycobacterium arosiense TaxID=425468 RepID=UPI001FECAFDE|nr:aldehyde dehydrogenase family protein [Mycobacterium arosiense]